MKPRKTAVPAIAILIVALVMGAPTLLYPFARDQAIFAYIGDVWLRGGLPYRDAWDVKPPLIFLVYSLAQAMFGHTMMAIRILDLVCTAGTGLLLLALGRRLGSNVGGAWAGVLYPVLYYACWRFPDTAQAESFAAPIAVLMFLGALEVRRSGGLWSALGTGVCVGLMALLKTTLVMYALPALLLVLWRRKGRAPLIVPAVAGTVLPIVLTAGYFALRGALGTLSELLHAQAAYATPRFTWLQSIHYFGWFLVHWPLMIWAFVVGLAALADKRLKVGWALGFVWLAIALANAFIQRRFFTYHAVPAAVPVALVGGLGIAAISSGLSASRVGLVRIVGATAMIAVPLLLLLPAMDRYQLAVERWSGKLSEHDYLSRMMGPEEFVASEVVDTGRLVASVTRPEDPVLVIGFEPMIYFVAHRYSPTRHLSADPWLYERQIDPKLRVEWTGQLLRDTTLRHPSALVVLGPRFLSLMAGSKDVWPEDVTFRSRPYRKVGTIGPYRVYRLGDGVPQPGAMSVESAYPIMGQAIDLGLANG